MDKKPLDPANGRPSDSANSELPCVSSGIEADPLHPDAALRADAVSAANRKPTKYMKDTDTSAKGHAVKNFKAGRIDAPGAEAKLVGYGCPPRANQFKPGQSGNRSGRPKGAKNHKSLLYKLLNRTISIRQGNKITKCTKREAILLRCLEQALRGDLKAAAFLLNQDEKSASAYAAQEVTRITEGMSLQEASDAYAAMLRSGE